MAKSEGVEVVRIDCSEVFYVANEYGLKEMPGWAELTELAAKVRRGEKLPVARSRVDLLIENVKLRAENAKLRAEIEKLSHGQGSHVASRACNVM